MSLKIYNLFANSFDFDCVPSKLILLSVIVNWNYFPLASLIIITIIISIEFLKLILTFFNF